MSDRRDYLAVCNNLGVPLPEFQETFCVRCVQPQCSRSKAGGLFDTRVATWRDRLFVNPPRMSEEDPRYAGISTKMFREIDVGGRVPEVGRALGGSAWVDPLALDGSRSEPKLSPRAAAPAPVTAAPTVEAASSPTAAPVERRGPRAPVNTPFVQGTMIGAAVSPKPVADPWGPALVEPAPPTPSGKVISPGARIRFRGGSG